MEKLYFTLRELADELHIDVQLIRKWEQELNLQPMQKSKSATKRFSVKDAETLRKYKYLTLDKGFNGEKARQMLAGGTDPRTKEADVEQVLTEIRDFLVRLKEAL